MRNDHSLISSMRNVSSVPKEELNIERKQDGEWKV
jgi:hypothetical protein